MKDIMRYIWKPFSASTRFALRIVSEAPARLSLLQRSVAVSLRLAVWHFPDRVNAWRRRTPPWRIVGVATLAVVVALPSVLFLAELSRRMELSRAYGTLAHSSASEIATLRYTMGGLLTEQSQLKELLLDAGYAVYTGNEFAVAMTATGYSSTPIETDDTPFVTAANTRTRSGIVAMSRDMLQRYNPEAPFAFGDIVHISGVGDFVVEDSMNPRWRRRVDVWFPSRTAAFQFGRQKVIIKARRDDSTETAYEYSLPLNLARGNASSP